MQGKNAKADKGFTGKGVLKFEAKEVFQPKQGNNEDGDMMEIDELNDSDLDELLGELSIEDIEDEVDANVVR